MAVATPTTLSSASSGPSLRNGFSLSLGQEMGDGPPEISGQLYGVDWRIGAKLSDAVAVYLHSHISFGTASVGMSSGVTGNLAAAVMGEYTFPFRVFVGAGGGYGVLNNPSGPLAELRAGYYPFKNNSDSKVRRLNVALDARWYFPGAPVNTVTHIALSLGYDRF